MLGEWITEELNPETTIIFFEDGYEQLIGCSLATLFDISLFRLREKERQHLGDVLFVN